MPVFSPSYFKKLKLLDEKRTLFISYQKLSKHGSTILFFNNILIVSRHKLFMFSFNNSLYGEVNYLYSWAFLFRRQHIKYSCCYELIMITIITENGINPQSSNPGWGSLQVSSLSWLLQRHESVPTTSYGKIGRQIRFFNLGKTFTDENGNSLKNWSYDTSCLWWMGWVNTVDW